VEDFTFAHPGGETNAAAQRRVVAVVDRLLTVHPTGGFLVATHGNLLTLLLRHFDPAVGFEDWDRLGRPDAFRLCLERGAASFERIWQR
jgi:2,3-bisphosphoglycerate-dependent phosphoglycerate mutase